MRKFLTRQEKVFAQNYALSGNGRASAILAGYSESNGSTAAARLLARERVRDEIKRIEATELSDKKVTKEMMQAFLVGLMKDTTLTVDQRLKSAEMVCKLNGLFMRSIDKLLALSSDEIQQAVRDMQQTITVPYQQIGDGK